MSLEASLKKFEKMNDKVATRTEFENVMRAIFDHIENGETFKRPRRIRKQLDLHRDPEWEREWLEAFTILNCYQRVAPARTHGALARLRKLRLERGEIDQFDAFMDKIDEVLSPDAVTPHGYNRTFSNMDSDAIFNSLGDVAAPLAELDCPLFLYAGALLGHQRSGALIGHDDDIDIGIFLGDCADSNVPQLWASYKRGLAKAGLLTDTEIQANRLSFKLKTDLPVDVDLFPAWTHQGKFSVYPYSFGELEAEAIFPLKSFGQDPLMLPSSPEALLSQSYGVNWRTPDPLFHLNWLRKKRIFHYLSDFDFTL